MATQTTFSQQAKLGQWLVVAGIALLIVPSLINYLLEAFDGSFPTPSEFLLFVAFLFLARFASIGMNWARWVFVALATFSLLFKGLVIITGQGESFFDWPADVFYRWIFEFVVELLVIVFFIWAPPIKAFFNEALPMQQSGDLDA